MSGPGREWRRPGSSTGRARSRTAGAGNSSRTVPARRRRVGLRPVLLGASVRPQNPLRLLRRLPGLDPDPRRAARQRRGRDVVGRRIVVGVVLLVIDRTVVGALHPLVLLLRL